MNIPFEFTLGGFTWKVVMRKRLKGRYGECDLKKRQIHLLSTLDQQLLEQTFCHELGHCIGIAMGINTDDHKEQDIDAWATFLHQFLTSAKYENTSAN